jgi:hypothetical protein
MVNSNYTVSPKVNYHPLPKMVLFTGFLFSSDGESRNLALLYLEIGFATTAMMSGG